MTDPFFVFRQHFLRFFVVLLVAAPALAQELSYTLFTNGCVPDLKDFDTQSSTRIDLLSCGDHGTFVLADGPVVYRGPSSCPPHVSGEEVPSLYPPPAAQPEQAGREGDWQPCGDGSCFAPPSAKWAAIVDWNDVHGWSVAETVLQASDDSLSVSLYALDEPQLESLEGLTGVGDGHVLAQLCRVVEEAEGFRPPEVVNLSFGRIPGPGEVSSSGIPTEEGLGRRIHEVLEHLGSLGTATVAAAGNHRQLLYPAASTHALAVGMMDLAALSWDGDARLAWQSPEEAAGVFPGYGLHLPRGGGETGCQWPVPAGSSYSSALASGAIAFYRAAGGRWRGVEEQLTVTAVDGTYSLLLDGVVLPESRLLNLTAMLDGALAGSVDSCSERPAPELSVLYPAQGGGPPPPSPPLIDVMLGHGPTPTPRPCVPCEMGTNGDIPSMPQDAVLYLAASWPLPAGVEIVGLSLRVGDSVHPLESLGLAAIFDALELGEAASLGLQGIGPYLEPGLQASLVFEIEVEGEKAWHSSPIHLPASAVWDHPAG